MTGVIGIDTGIKKGTSGIKVESSCAWKFPYKGIDSIDSN